MDLNMSNFLIYGSQHMSNRECGEDNMGDTALRLNCYAHAVNSTANVTDSCIKELPARDDDRCVLALGLGCTSSYGNIHPFAAENRPKDLVSHLKQTLSHNVGCETLQLGLSWDAGELSKNTERDDQTRTYAEGRLYPSARNALLSVVDEGSTNGGGFMPSLLLARTPGNECGGMDTLEVMAFSNEHHHSPDPSATTDCSGANFIDLAAEDNHPSRTRVHHPKKCRFKGCSKGARGASGLCIAHGGGQRCQKPGCNKGAESRTAFCKAHGGGRRCEELGCTKSAEGKTDFCIAHGGGRRCGQEGCTKASRGRSGLCIRHGGGKRCSAEGCTRSAEGQAGLCISHGGGRRCQHPGCTKGAQGSTVHCKAHGGGRRCIVEGCTKGAEGSTPLCKGHGGGKRCLHDGGGICTKSVHGGTDYCVAHGGGKRCAVPGCTKSARGRTDCCVKHGGGKRCKHEGCGKSAQGSTDFCKAHGGGRRCSWAGGCDKFARGRTGLCAAHGNRAAAARQGSGSQNLHAAYAPGQFSGLASTSSMDDDYSSGASASALSRSRGRVPLLIPSQMLVPQSMRSPFDDGFEAEKSSAEHESSDGDGCRVPEGRVHGGGLLSLLGGNFHVANFAGNNGLV